MSEGKFKRWSVRRIHERIQYLHEQNRGRKISEGAEIDEVINSWNKKALQVASEEAKPPSKRDVIGRRYGGYGEIVSSGRQLKHITVSKSNERALAVARLLRQRARGRE